MHVSFHLHKSRATSPQGTTAVPEPNGVAGLPHSTAAAPSVLSSFSAWPSGAKIDRDLLSLTCWLLFNEKPHLITQSRLENYNARNKPTGMTETMVIAVQNWLLRRGRSINLQNISILIIKNEWWGCCCNSSTYFHIHKMWLAETFQVKCTSKDVCCF